MYKKSKSYNLFDFYIILLIGALCFGRIGGAFEVERLLAILLAPILYVNIFKTGCGYARLIFKWLVLFYLFFVVSILWSPDKMEGIKELIYFLIEFILFLELIVFARFAMNPMKSLSNGWLITVLLCSLVAIWEITTGNHLSYAEDQNYMRNIGDEIIQQRAASVTFGNYNSYVAFLCFSFPWIVYLFFEKGRSFFSIIFTILVLIMGLIVVIFNASRGGFLSVIIMLVVYVTLSKKSIKKSLFFIVLFSLIGFVIIKYGDSIFALIIARSSDGGLISDDSRSEIWSNTLKAFSDTYGMGVGVGGVIPSITQYAHGGISVPHHLILEILVEFGIIITLVVLLFIFRLFFKSMKVERHRKVVLLMSLLSMPIYSIIDSRYLFSSHFYALLATIYIFANYELIKRPNGTLRQTA